MEQIYFGDFVDEQDYCEEYGIPDLGDYKVLFAYYDYSPYSGETYDLLLKGDKLFVNEASHCSCYGLDGKFNPVETSYEAMKKECPLIFYVHKEPWLICLSRAKRKGV